MPFRLAALVVVVCAGCSRGPATDPAAARTAASDVIAARLRVAEVLERAVDGNSAEDVREELTSAFAALKAAEKRLAELPRPERNAAEKEYRNELNRAMDRVTGEFLRINKDAGL